MVTGTPAVLIPSPNVAEDHQTQNALSMERAGAARLLREPDLAARLVPDVTALLDDAGALRDMAAAARAHARPNAAEDIARHILEVCHAA
jgi:UDP-N-acetylglucosamine--N-acetylmuramyl-(pentapeptide) pyrophosphoryl-undecaprenol N-acetylglucosamine transferase